LSPTQKASGESSRLLIAPLVLFPMIIHQWRQRQRLEICTRQTIAAATFVSVVVAAIALGSTLAVATATPTALGDTIFFMKLLDNPTIVSIVGVLFVEDAVAAMSTFIALRAVPAVLLILMLHLGSLDFGFGGSASSRLCMKSLPSSALVHQSAISKSLMTKVSSSFMDNFSLILMSEMPVENAEMTSSLEILGILFLI
jgi:hypothetical protein